MPYQVEFAASVRSQLSALTADERARVLAAVETQLLHEPLVETRHRKPLRPNPVAPWELRVGQLPVFYDVRQADPQAGEPQEALGVVYILAVGRKEGDVLWIGGKRVQL